ncbi:MAG: hypothetical protein V5A61_07350 [Haloarculaceae archaeon]
MRHGPPSTLLLVLVLLLALAGPPGAATGAPAAAPDTGRPALQADTFDPNTTVIELDLSTDGDARWTITHSFALDDANDTRAFERLAEAFERGDVGGSYVRTMRRAREATSEETGREMTIRNVSRQRVVENGTGRLVTTFAWTSFARASGDTLRVGDAFTIGTETWLPGLASDERLVVSPPPGYRIDNAPSADSFRNGSLVWEGPTEFDSGYLSITYRKLTPPPEPPNATDSATPAGPFDGQLLPIVGGLFGVGLLLLVAYLLFRRERPAGPVAEANGGVDSGPDDGGATGTAEGTEPTAEPTEPAAGSEPAEPDEADGADGADESAVDPELLSDEERVEYLLRRNGGRMKQANIVKETNWSNAKVSQLLSSMDEAGRIDKLRIGRENLITLPDEEPGEFGE